MRRRRRGGVLLFFCSSVLLFFLVIWLFWQLASRAANVADSVCLFLSPISHLPSLIAETWDCPLDTTASGGGGKKKMGAQSRYYAPDRSGVRCYNCDQTGHMSFDCPKYFVILNDF